MISVLRAQASTPAVLIQGPWVSVASEDACAPSTEEVVMKRIFAQIRKELTQFSRDKLTVALALVLPLIIMWLLGCAVSLTVTDLPVVVQDWDQTLTSRHYYDTIKSSLTFRVVDLGLNESPESALDNGKARAAIVIPQKFERDLQRGQSVEVQWLIDGSDANTGNLMRNDANQLTQAF